MKMVFLSLLTLNILQEMTGLNAIFYASCREKYLA